MGLKITKKNCILLLVVVFGMGSWIGVNAFWVQLPLIVPVLPEGWNLPSYLAVIVQLGNIGPLIYTILTKKLCHSLAGKCVGFIMGIFCISLLSMTLLSHFWSYTLWIGGSYHSVALFIFTFFISVASCTSNVVSLPYMSRYKPCHITAYFVGAGLSGLIPSMLALGQGSFVVDCLVNTSLSDNVTQLMANDSSFSNNLDFVPVIRPPHFSAKIFFLVIALLIFLSLLAFLSLQFISNGTNPPTESINATDPTRKTSLKDSEAYKKDVSNTFIKKEKPANRFSKCLLFTLVPVISAVTNAVLPSIQTYSALPYGLSAYHFAVVIMGLANPIGSFTTFFLKPKQPLVLALIAMFGIACAGYMIALAVLSPYPPLANAITGKILMVCGWGLCGFSLAFVRTSIARVLRVSGGERQLFLFGLLTQAGTCLAAIVIFPFVNIVSLFKSASLC